MLAIAITAVLLIYATAQHGEFTVVEERLLGNSYQGFCAMNPPRRRGGEGLRHLSGYNGRGVAEVCYDGVTVLGNRYRELSPEGGKGGWEGTGGGALNEKLYTYQTRQHRDQGDTT